MGVTVRKENQNIKNLLSHRIKSSKSPLTNKKYLNLPNGPPGIIKGIRFERDNSKESNNLIQQPMKSAKNKSKIVIKD